MKSSSYNFDFSLPGYSSEEVATAIAKEAVSTPSGQSCKFASDAGSSFFKRNVYEAGFARVILPFESITFNDPRIKKFPNSEYPIAMFEEEPATRPSVTLPFDQSTETWAYKGAQILMQFFKIATPEMRKNVITINNYGYDIQKVVLDGLLKNMETQEDFVWISLCEQTVAHTKAEFNFAGNLTRSVIKAISTILLRNKYEHGTNLINAATFAEITEQNKDWTGGALQEKLFFEGTKALQDKTVGGMKWLTTMKSDIVPDNVIWTYAPQDYLGKICQLQAPVVYTKKEKDIITTSAEEILGMVIANEIGVNKVTINDGDTVITNTYPQVKAVTKIAVSDAVVEEDTDTTNP